VNNHRTAQVSRTTKETQISLDLSLDGTGIGKITTGIGFFDHMLDLFTHHGLFDLTVTMTGDLGVDGHHSVEDVGIALGTAFRNALGDGRGIVRYASGLTPMDETLVQVAIDISNRPHLSFNCPLPKASLGGFDVELTEEFFNAFVTNARISLHIDVIRGSNLHHLIEACFKGFGRLLGQAVQLNPRQPAIPSTKGIL